MYMYVIYSILKSNKRLNKKNEQATKAVTIWFKLEFDSLCTSLNQIVTTFEACSFVWYTINKVYIYIYIYTVLDNAVLSSYLLVIITWIHCTSISAKIMAFCFRSSITSLFSSKVNNLPVKKQHISNRLLSCNI